jgi:hypothetical protein
MPLYIGYTDCMRTNRCLDENVRVPIHTTVNRGRANDREDEDWRCGRDIKGIDT